MRRAGISRLLTGLRLVRVPVILIVLYLALHLVMAALSARHGFGSPDGTGPGYLAVSVALLALRMALLVVVPAVLTYRVVAYAVTHIPRRADPTTRPNGVAGSNAREAGEAPRVGS
ncbi:hypothetical protein [Nocardia sp. NPDC050793]|uniref:hypothetical protein n=1 Tax=Nocardia sp. NPDC050793 TaxID=3155159 RepID=UPI00340F41D5